MRLAVAGTDHEDLETQIGREVIMIARAVVMACLALTVAPQPKPDCISSLSEFSAAWDDFWFFRYPMGYHLRTICPGWIDWDRAAAKANHADPVAVQVVAGD